MTLYLTSYKAVLAHFYYSSLLTWILRFLRAQSLGLCTLETAPMPGSQKLEVFVPGPSERGLSQPHSAENNNGGNCS